MANYYVLWHNMNGPTVLALAETLLEARRKVIFYRTKPRYRTWAITIAKEIGK